MAKFASGQLTYQIPSVTSFRNAVATGTANVQIQLNNQYGKKLKRVLTTFYNPTETLNLAFDHQNYNGAKVTSVQTYIDSQTLQDSAMSCLQPVTDDTNIGNRAGAQNMDDWRENARHCRNSAIQDSASYYLNWFHCDKFSEKNFYTSLPDENINEGLDLSMPRAWSVQVAAAAAQINYTFCSFIKDLAITPSGPMLV
jgi:hypothetical protein